LLQALSICLLFQKEKGGNFVSSCRGRVDCDSKISSGQGLSPKNAKHKEIIVSHAAYGYWEKRYGIKQLSISGLSSSSEPTQRELKQIIKTAQENDLNYVFLEQNVSTKLAEVVRKEIKAEPLYLHNLSVLTDADIKNKRTYFSIMNDNLKALETALAK